MAASPHSWTSRRAERSLRRRTPTSRVSSAELPSRPSRTRARRTWRGRPGPAPRWLSSVAVFGAGVALFDGLVYGGPLTSGYRPGEITFSFGAVLPNLRYMPAHLIQAMPMLVPGLAALAWIAPAAGR
jgi:hypothetical protein